MSQDHENHRLQQSSQGRQLFELLGDEHAIRILMVMRNIGDRAPYSQLLSVTRMGPSLALGLQTLLRPGLVRTVQGSGNEPPTIYLTTQLGRDMLYILEDWHRRVHPWTMPAARAIDEALEQLLVWDHDLDLTGPPAPGA